MLCYVMWRNVTWKSKVVTFGQLLLNLTHYAAPQTDIEPRYPWTQINTRAVRFVLSSLLHNPYYLKID
jgi:hypothetical protein